MQKKITEQSAYSDSSINAFLNNFKSIARTNRFEIEIIPPKGITKSNVTIDKNTYDYSMNSKFGNFANKINSGKIITFSCNSVVMPGKSIETTNDLVHNIKMPTRYNIDNFAITFIETENLLLKEFFTYWQSMVTSFSNKMIFYYDDYISTINIFQLNKHNKRTFQTEIIEAYPTMVSSNEYSHNSDDNNIQTTVSFGYKNWIMHTGTSEIITSKLPSLTSLV